ncbi:MAG: hypothetical protein GX299_08295 [Epulopiscium sp.]|jgi:hypothetical protein|nr:hypothetical protein [Candidatus Epulonipiscium sp.]
MSIQSGRKKYYLAILLVCLFGMIVGVLYIDGKYGGGQIKAYVTQYVIDRKQESKDGKKEPIQEENNIDEPSQGADEAQQQEQPSDKIRNSDMKQEFNLNSKTSFCTFDKEFLMSSKDGVKYFRGMKEQKWNDTFTMTNPFLIKEGNYAAVGDLGGRSVQVYNEEGLRYRIQTEGTLVFFSMNTNGYLAVISKDAETYKVMIYKGDGSLLKGRVEETEGVYPLSVDISDDNKVFAISYLDSSDIEPIARVLFFYIEEKDGENYTDSMFAAVEKENQVIPMVAFMEDGTLAAPSDREVYGINQKGKEIWHKQWSNYVDFIQIEKKYITVALGGVLPNQEGQKNGTVVWINSKGKETGNMEEKGEVSYLKSSGDYTVIGRGKKYFGTNESGKVLWEYSASEDIYDMLPLENTNVLYVTKSAAKIVDMKNYADKISDKNKK